MLIVEKDIETFLKNRVEHLGGRCIKFPAMFEEGIPDRIVILPGGLIAFAELKRPSGGKLSNMQTYQITRLRRLGCRVYVVKNYEEVNAMLQDMTEEKK